MTAHVPQNRDEAIRAARVAQATAWLRKLGIILDPEGKPTGHDLILYYDDRPDPDDVAETLVLVPTAEREQAVGLSAAAARGRWPHLTRRPLAQA